MRGVSIAIFIVSALLAVACAGGAATPTPPEETVSSPTATPKPTPTATLEPMPTPTTTSEPTAITGPRGELAVLKGDLWLVDLGGGEPRRLGDWFPTFSHLYFRWSPDGEEIVYGEQADLWVLDAEMGEARNLTNTPDRWELMPAWSPDGMKIAFTSRPMEPEEYGKTEWTMFGVFGGQLTIVGADGNDYRILDEQGTISSSPPSWSPDSRRLAYAADGNLYTFDLERDQKEQIVLEEYGLQSDLYICAPSWSPQRDAIAIFFYIIPAPGEVSAEHGYALLDLANETSTTLKSYVLTQLMAYEGHALGPVVGCVQRPALWNPLGDYLLLNILPLPRTDLPGSLSLIDARGEKEIVLVESPGAYQADWSPNGRWVAYISLGGRSVFVIDPFNPEERRLYKGAQAEGLAWRPKEDAD